jgi:hypothetical protein
MAAFDSRFAQNQFLSRGKIVNRYEVLGLHSTWMFINSGITLYC